MKKLGVVCLIMCLIFTFHGVMSVAAQEESNGSVINGCHSIDASVPFLGTSQLVDNAKSVILFEMNSETLMYAWNADEQMSPASLVKIMTALLAIEKGNMDDPVLITEDVLFTVPDEAVSAELQADEVLSLQDLIYCMLVGSANDAAAVIADYVSGSQGAFVAEMNRYASEIGCTDTQFMNVHGLHDDQQYTTARDTARILAVAMKNELFRNIFGAVSYTVPATTKSEERELVTGNHLMTQAEMEIYYDARVTGGRTGITEDGYRCIASTAEQNGLALICVVLGAESVYTEDGYTEKVFGGFKETSALLDLGFSGHKNVQILYENQALKQSAVLNGASDVVIGPQISVSTILPDSVTSEQLTYRYADTGDSYTAPIEKGQKLSYVEVWYDGTCVAQADLFALNSVSVAMPVNDNTDSGDIDGNWPIILTVLAVFGGIFVLIIGIRVVGKMRLISAKKRSRRYRKNRRRSR